MSKETNFRYYAASTTSSTIPGPGGRPRSTVLRSTSEDAEAPVGLSGVTVKVAAGAGDKCVAPARSRPKRRQTVRNGDYDDDTLDVRSVQWTSRGVSVSELANSYQGQFPLLAKVTDDCADFVRGQVTDCKCCMISYQ